MGSCVSTLTLSPDLIASLQVNPDLTTLLSLQLHYSCYDKVSQKKIDQLSMIALNTDHSIHFSNQSSETEKK
jgi:hypothetical protein